MLSDKQYYKLSENIFDLKLGVRFVTILGNQGASAIDNLAVVLYSLLDPYDQKLSAEHYLDPGRLERDLRTVLERPSFPWRNMKKPGGTQYPLIIISYCLSQESKLSNNLFIENVLELVDTFKNESDASV